MPKTSPYEVAPMNPQPSRAGLRKLALTLPDVPRWVETRGLLLSGRCDVYGFNPTSSSNYVVKDRGGMLISVVGKPEPDAILNAVKVSEPTVEVIATPENHKHVASVLAGWNGEKAWIHELDGRFVYQKRDDVTVTFAEETDILRIQDEFPDLAKELLGALSFSKIAAVFVQYKPVSFCYAGTETEKLWDISIETLPDYRRRGLATACVGFLIDSMLRKGKSPVWGALESNLASLNLAQKLGFQIIDHLYVFSSVRP